MTPKHFRKRPVVIEAVQYDGSFPVDFLANAENVRMVSGLTGWIEITTLEGVMRAEIGDWIIFRATYEPVEPQ